MANRKLLKEIVKQDPLAKREFLHKRFLRDTLAIGNICVIKYVLNRIF